MISEGDEVPDHPLLLADGVEARPSDWRRRALVLYFYPRDDTPGCTTEARDFSALLPAFADAGAAVVGVSRDPPEKHARFAAKHGLTVPLATDGEGALMEALGAWGDKTLYGRTRPGVIRTTLLIDREGRVARIWRKVRVKGHAEAVLEAARALR